RHPGWHTHRRLGPAHHGQHPDLGHRAGRAAPGRQPRQGSRARHRRLGALTPRRPAENLALDGGVTEVSRQPKEPPKVRRGRTVAAALAGGMSTPAAIPLAAPARAKGPTRARTTAPGLPHAIVTPGNGEPGLQSRLTPLAMQTRLFFVLFGSN